MAAECPNLDLGGRTLAEPCGWSGVCGFSDFQTCREYLVREHNALVRALTAWNQLVAEGKQTWTPIPTASWAVYEESWALLEKYPPGLFDNLNLDTLDLGVPVRAFINLAMRDHAAGCDMQASLIAAGEAVPSVPVPPPDKEGTAEKALQVVREAGAGAVKIVGLVAVTVIAYAFLSRK